MSSRWTGFFIWALVAASSAFWGFKIFAATRPVPIGAQAPLAAVPPSGPMERLFGAVVVAPPPVEAPHPDSERFQLVGVIAPGGRGDGLAVVAIDGQPAKPWHIGATLDGNTTLLSVAKRTADFGPTGGPSAFTLTLPEPAAAETGSLPVAVSQPDNAVAPPPVAVSPRVVPHVAQPGIPGMPRGNVAGRQAQAQRGGAVLPQIAPGRMAQQPGQAIPIEQPQPKPEGE